MLRLGGLKEETEMKTKRNEDEDSLIFLVHRELYAVITGILPFCSLCVFQLFRHIISVMEFGLVVFTTGLVNGLVLNSIPPLNKFVDLIMLFIITNLPPPP
jgi:hypothetical protein